MPHNEAFYRILIEVCFQMLSIQIRKENKRRILVTLFRDSADQWAGDYFNSVFGVRPETVPLGPGHLVCLFTPRGVSKWLLQLRGRWNGMGEGAKCTLWVIQCPWSCMFVSVPRLECARKCSCSTECDITFRSSRSFTFAFWYHAMHALGIVIILVLTVYVERCARHLTAGHLVKQF